MQIDFNADFVRVNNQGILYMLSYVGIGVSVVYIDVVSINPITARLVDGCWRKLVNVVSGVPQVSVVGPLSSLLYTSEFFLSWKVI